MQLKDSFYTARPVDGGWQVHLQADHFIFKAHFPEQPVVPGVCQLKMAEELLSAQTGRPLFLKEIKQIKYMKLLTPVQTPDLGFFFASLAPTETSLSVACQVCGPDGAVYTKMSLVFVYERF